MLSSAFFIFIIQPFSHLSKPGKMKRSFNTRRFIAIAQFTVTVLFFFITQDAYGQTAQSQIIGVTQTMDATMSPATLGGLHVTFTYSNSRTSPVFLNIWAQIPGQQNSAWVAKNICLSPFNGSRRLERSISLSQLGVPDSVRVPAIRLYAQQSDTPLTNPVTPQVFNSFNCPLDSLFMFDGPSAEFVDAGGPEYLGIDFKGPVTANVPRGCKVPNEDLDDSKHPAVKNGYAGDVNACGPAAVANSLSWLEATIAGVGKDGLTDRQRLEELSALMGRKNKGDGVRNGDIVQAKISFVAKYKLKVKVEFLAASGDFNEDLKWLDDQYKANQDIELDYSYTDQNGNVKSHAVVLTDLNLTGKVSQISVKDDKKQKTPGGNDEEKNLELKPSVGGYITFLRDGRLCTVNNMYAESLDTNAGTFTDPNTHETSTVFCAKSEKTCIGACPALIALYDSSGKPITTYPICAGKNTCCDIHTVYTPGGTNCTANKKGKCQGECPPLYRSKKDAKRRANPVGGKCDKAACNCVYEFASKKDNKRNVPFEQSEGKLKIYPNPVSQQINIVVNGIEGTYRLTVVNVLGQRLIEKTIELNGESEKITLDVSGFANGVYYVVLRNNEEQLGGIFMKN
jgi:hypothetical protein